MILVLESDIKTFTTNLRGEIFMKYYEELTHNHPGTGVMLSLVDSNWDLTISIPHQPVIATRSNYVNIMWGYALNPPSEGNFIKKAMFACSGRDFHRGPLPSRNSL
ncbi:uncharacterized protein ATNIH1004_002567 [Aspergillus tanneri]|uniref:Uncharacterized protein n=1 Tax=Aspergillus tanneri TaxID=1220188 RepID=A0A5M9MSR7_9EURO|nr:uncharacterized protein ATNIH1004_002567 [Aspergillus tanneri]KAA8649888.1 hypothetical protein ATNIH1004_002567 [Aspergillus tanneri]